MTLLLFILRHALVCALLAATAWSAGALAMRRRRRPSQGEDAIPLPMTVANGLALLAQTSLLLGLAGWLRLPIVVAVAIGVNVAAARAWRHAAAEMTRAHARALTDVRRRGSLATCAIVTAIVAAVAGPPFLLALYPPLGFDQTLYHLPYARAFAASGGLPFLPLLRFPVFPQLGEALNAAVLLLAADDVSTQMTGWLALLTCAGLVFVWTREQSSAAGGSLAAAMLVGSPIAVYLAATGYVEPMLGLFGLASLYAADRARRRREIAWIVAAGALAGSAASLKYLGLFFVPAAALLMWQPAWRTTWRRALAWYGVAGAAALAMAYGRLIALTGNPLFPFYPAIFGGSAWEAQEYLGRRGVARLLAAATFLWDITFRRHAVGGLPFWSPMFAIGAPVALLGAWRLATLRPLLLLAIGYLALAPVNSHYFFAIAPLWCVIVGVGASWLAESSVSGRRLLMAAAISVALGGDAYTLYRVHKLGLPPATPEGREQLLSAELPLYPAIAFLNRTAGRVIVYGVHAENMVDYAAGTLLGDYNGPASYAHVAERARGLGSLASALEQVRASYLLIPARESSWTQQAAADHRLTRIYGDDSATLYRILPARRP